MSRAEQQRDVFVSYAHENADWVRALAGNLHQLGLEVWFDEWDIVGGVRLSSVCRKAWPPAGPWCWSCPTPR